MSGSSPAKPTRAVAPKSAASAAGRLKRSHDRASSACLPTRASLKRLFARCTTAVAAMAVGTGKNTAKAGMSKVPRPNPEKRVSPETTSAVTPIST